MKVIRAKTLGFCSGVKRAIDIAYANSVSKKPVYTIGPLIHNPQVLEELQRRGIKTLNEDNLPENLHGAVVIIRAHGVSPQTEAELRKRGGTLSDESVALIDATCPKVKSSQLKAEEFVKAGYRLFLAGEERHAEIIGIRGYAHLAVFAVVGNAAEARVAAAKLHKEAPHAPTAIIGQTTISAEEYREICSAIMHFFPNLEIAQTICNATEERQDSLRELAGKVDAVIIAGGKDSANTLRLLTIAESTDKPCVLAEIPVDIPPDFLKYETIGLASGTSTPDSVIDDIERSLTASQPTESP